MVDMKNIVSHLVNGTLGESLCRVCLSPLDVGCENVFTEICKDEKAYCIADVLENVSQIKFNPEDVYCVCSNCFHIASIAYKFYHTCQRTEAILGFYLTELDTNVQLLERPMENPGESVCISLPLIETTETFDYDPNRKPLIEHPTGSDIEVDMHIKNELLASDEGNYENEGNVEDADENVVIILDEHGKRNYYNVNEEGTLEQIHKDEKKSYEIVFRNTEVGKHVINTIKEMRPKKDRKVRSPMGYIHCSKCPVRYRFLSKLKDHMKADHGIDLYICKVCKFITDAQKDYHNHMEIHTDIFTCDSCGMCFKKRTTLIQHLRRHQESKTVKVQEGAHVCEVCGQILPDALHLKEHCDKKHDKKYTCFYCGRSYKGEAAFESHIRKHEQHIGSSGERHTCAVCQSTFSSAYRLDKHLTAVHGGAPAYECDVYGCARSFKTEAALRAHARAHNSEFSCDTCGRGFVDARALLWHQRLHTNERPYECQECGRGFVTAYRRDAHALCAHTAPARRCPLCPALFHLRSMVNSHIKKVHLKAHKRRNRNSKWGDAGAVGWHTEPVPLQELSVAIQSDLLEMRTNERVRVKQ